MIFKLKGENGMKVITSKRNARDENTANKGKGKWISKDSGRVHFCSECGWGLADDPNCESPYIMLSDQSRDNEERWMGQYGWCEWLMNYCPNCGKNMKKTE